MTHQRKTIRDAIVAALDDGSIVASGKVYSNRALSNWESSLPIINVINESETSEPEVVTNTTLFRNLTISITAYAKNAADESLDDSLDALAELIESKMTDDPTIGDTVLDSNLSETQMGSNAEGGIPLGAIQLIYSAMYRT